MMASFRKRLTLMFALFLLLGAVQSLYASAASTSLVMNSGFETDEDGDGYPDGWMSDTNVNIMTNSGFELGTAVPTDWSSDGNGSNVLDRTVARTGTGSAKLVGKNSLWTGFRHKDIPVEAGTTYRMGMYVKTDNVNSKSKVFVSFGIKDKSGTFIVPDNNAVTNALLVARTGTHDWEYVEGLYTIPANGVSISYFRVRINPSAGTQGETAWFDDLTIRRVGGTDSTQSHSGSRSLKLVGFTDTAVEEWHTADMPVTASRAYKYSAFVKADSVTGATYLSFRFKDTQGGILSPPLTSLPLSSTSDWSEQSGRIIAPPNAAAVVASVYLKGAGTVWYDDISLVEDLTPVPATIGIDSPGPVIIPFEGENHYVFTAVVRDQFGQILNNPNLKWTLSPPATGVGIGMSSGILSVSNAAVSQTVTLRAESSDNSFVFKDVAVDLVPGFRTEYDIKNGQMQLRITGENIGDLYAAEAVFDILPDRVQLQESLTDLDAVYVKPVIQDNHLYTAFTLKGQANGLNGQVPIAALNFTSMQTLDGSEVKLASVTVVNSLMKTTTYKYTPVLRVDPIIRPLNQTELTVTGSVYRPAVIQVNNVQAAVYGQSFKENLNLSQGNNKVSIHASDAFGTLAEQMVVTLFADSIPPAPVSGLRVTELSANSLMLQWNPTTDNTGVVTYSVYKNGSLYESVASNVYSMSVRGLTANTSYTFNVRAVDAAGNWSDAGPGMIVNTLTDTQPPVDPPVQPPTNGDTTPPTPVKGLQVTEITRTSVKLQWNPSTDNTGVVTYSVYKDGTSIQTVAGNVYSVTLNGLRSGTMYTFSVKAADTSGNWSAVGDEITITTQMEYIYSTRSSSSGTTSGTASEPVPVPSSGENASQMTTLSIQAIKQTMGDGTAIWKAVPNPTALASALNQLKGKPPELQKLILEVNQNQTDAKLQVELPAGLLNDSRSVLSQAWVVIKSGNYTYEIPMKALQLEDWAKRLSVNLSAVTLNIKIGSIPSVDAKLVEQKASESGMKLLMQPTEFQMMVSAGAQVLEVTDFGSTYVTRTFILSSPANPAATTGVWIQPSTGEFRFVPTVFLTSGQGTQAIIKRPGNSVYSVVSTSKISFDDLTDHWAKADVDLLASKLLLQGRTALTYAPEAPVTRAEFAALIIRALGLNTDKKSIQFTDVSSSDWFNSYVEAAARIGLIDGFEDGSFKPSETITREQMALMVQRTLQWVGKSESKPDSGEKALLKSKYADAASIQPWADEAVVLMMKLGLMNGVTDQTYAPAQSVSRAQAAVVLKRLLQKLEFIN